MFMFEHDLRANASRLACGKPVPTPHQVRGRKFPDHAPAQHQTTKVFDTFSLNRPCGTPAVKCSNCA